MKQMKRRPCKRCCLEIRSKRPQNASDREIDATQKTVMSEHDQNLFIEQHNDGYAILRGGVEKPLAVEPTQDAAIEKARCSENINGSNRQHPRFRNHIN